MSCIILQGLFLITQWNRSILYKYNKHSNINFFQRLGNLMQQDFNLPRCITDVMSWILYDRLRITIWDKKNCMSFRKDGIYYMVDAWHSIKCMNIAKYQFFLGKWLKILSGIFSSKNRYNAMQIVNAYHAEHSRVQKCLYQN